MSESERNILVNSIEDKGVTDSNVLSALRKVEREKFVPLMMQPNAYLDIALPIGYGQTISQPYTVALMTQALKVKIGDKVLEIGTGSGYQAAILEKMGAKVYSIERHNDLYRKTQKLFDTLGIRVSTKCGDGTIGWSEHAPYDGIIVTAGSPEIPESLKKQLVAGGRLVIPVGGKQTQTLKVVTRKSEDKYEIESIPEFAFVPLIGREAWDKE
ncbi:MAG: protein-L-isoaspartate(D-aspartate) O-methyltransferase [Ignavibacteria bacterium]|nr:protein-L-isoaspartate(D-aspartate) O-methyltransferase [Ignavibacteria bacterium]